MESGEESCLGIFETQRIGKWGIVKTAEGAKRANTSKHFNFGTGRSEVNKSSRVFINSISPIIERVREEGGSRVRRVV